MDDGGKKTLSTFLVIVGILVALVRCVGAAARFLEAREAPARGTYVATAIISSLQQTCRPWAASGSGIDLASVVLAGCGG